MKKIGFVILLVAASLYFTNMSDAALTINGDGTWGDFTAELNYTDPTLTVTIENTSNATNGGYISAFVFNVPTNITGVQLFSSSDPDFNLLFDIDDVKAKPYGIFDVGATLGSNFCGGSQPWKGIDINIKTRPLDVSRKGSYSGRTEMAYYQVNCCYCDFLVCRERIRQNTSKTYQNCCKHSHNVVRFITPFHVTLLL